MALEAHRKAVEAFFWPQRSNITCNWFKAVAEGFGSKGDVEMTEKKHGHPAQQGAHKSTAGVRNAAASFDYSIVLGLALRLAGLGWWVFPCKADKRPLIPSAHGGADPLQGKCKGECGRDGHGFHDATIDPEKIRDWWGRWPGALVGVFCQKSGFFVLDVDNKNGKDGVASMDALIERFGDGSPAVYGPVQMTPNNGAHFLYKLPEDLAIPNNADKLGSGLDLRSNGYICTGAGYEWLPGHEPEAPVPEAPAWLLRALQEGEREGGRPPAATTGGGDAGSFWLSQALTRARVGNRNEVGFWLACQARDAGIGQSEVLDLSYPERVQQGTGPHYSRREWEASVRSAFSQEGREPAHSLAGRVLGGSAGGSNPPAPPILEVLEQTGGAEDLEDISFPVAAVAPELPKAARISDELRVKAEKVGGWLKDYVAFGCKAAPMAPAIFHQVIGQALLSAAIARRVCLPVGNSVIYPNIYALIVANSTLYTKSTAFQLGERTLEKAGLRRFLLPVGITPQSLISELTNRAPETFSDWEKGDQDDWREERANAGQRAWLMDESAGLLDAFNQKTTADLLTHVLKLYDCPSKLTAASTVGRGRQTIRNAYLTICGPTTPAAMRVHLSNPDHWGNGLFARFLFVTPDTAPVRNFYPAPIEVPDELAEQLRKLAVEHLEAPKDAGLGLTIPPKAEVVSLEAGVWEMWNAYHGGLWELMTTHQAPEKFFPNYGRLHVSAMKTALQLAAVDWSLAGGQGLIRLSRSHFAKGQLLVEDYRTSLHRMLETVSQVSEDDDLEKKILTFLGESEKGFTTREISRALHMANPLQRTILDQILERMQKDGLLERIMRKPARGPEVEVLRRKR